MVSIADRYNFYAVVLVVAALIVAFAGVFVIDNVANDGQSFAYLVLAYGLVLSAFIWFLAPRYWATVLRWRIPRSSA